MFYLIYLSQSVKSMNYDDFSMGFVNMDKAGEYPKFSDYIDEHLTLKSFDAAAEKACHFMVLFNKVC
jgi:hypothetical protein